ncbi:MAG: ATP-dependent Clp protease proteolytic subunit [Lachnospiraceae bacterium]|nr:ATP-dependent Clp protease proteolytic subunit [Lachnospiraceae bacterium]
MIVRKEILELRKDSVKNQEKEKKEKVERMQAEAEYIEETGSVSLEENEEKHKIELITIIGEVEGHENLSGSSKTTKYEHLLPKLAQLEDASDVDGVLVLLNTMGGDVEAGLAIAEMIASLSKPTVSLVLGGSHSIGVPIAVSADYSFIVKSAAMVIHPVRMSGMVIGTPATFDYFKSIQDRITGFVVDHSKIDKKTFESLMMETKILTKDVGSVLNGEKAVGYGIIDAVGGLSEAMDKLHEMIDERIG